MKAEEHLREKGIHPTEPIYWDLGHKTIRLDELMDDFEKSCCEAQRIACAENFEKSMENSYEVNPDIIRTTPLTV